MGEAKVAAVFGSGGKVAAVWRKERSNDGGGVAGGEKGKDGSGAGTASIDDGGERGVQRWESRRDTARPPVVGARGRGESPIGPGYMKID